MACLIVCYLVRNREAWTNVKQLETRGKTDEIACADTNFGQSHQFPHQASFGRYLHDERLTKTGLVGQIQAICRHRAC